MKIPAQYKDPIGIKKQYAAYILRYKDAIYKDWLVEIDRFLKGFDKYRIDDLAFDNIMKALNLLASIAFNKPAFILGVTKAGRSVGLWNTQKYNSVKVYKLLGFNDIPPKVENTLVGQWTNQNVRLIKNISESQAKAIEQMFYNSSIDGTSTKLMRQQLSGILKGDDARYKLIVDDQINKLNSNIDRIKQQKAGIKEFIWRTVGDDSVRSKHQEREGIVYKWADNDAPKPGQEIRCRCYAEPKLSDDINEIFE
jgi:SPP1 gp7 family putative phage head morphogenesis protein